VGTTDLPGRGHPADGGLVFAGERVGEGYFDRISWVKTAI
jgi:hypothetical protein